MLGILQILGDRGGSLYLYEITNPSAAVGLFANRNHQATLLALVLPMLALWGLHSQPTQILRKFIAFGGMAVLLPLILITGSRVGLITAAAGLVAMLTFLRNWSVSAGDSDGAGLLAKKKTRIVGWMAVVAIPTGLVAATILLGRAEAWDRLRLIFETEELRFKAFPAMTELASKYWPVGTGFGAFEKVFQANEPDALLSPVFLNHAHNDWLELLITGGLPAVALLVTAVCVSLLSALRRRTGVRQDPRSKSYRQLGLIIIGLFGIVSISDYPLRVPILQVYFIVAAVWASGPAILSLPMAETKITGFSNRNENRQGR